MDRNAIPINKKFHTGIIYYLFILNNKYVIKIHECVTRLYLFLYHILQIGMSLAFYNIAKYQTNF